MRRVNTERSSADTEGSSARMKRSPDGLSVALGLDLQRYLRIRISTKWDLITTGALEDKMNFYQYI